MSLKIQKIYKNLIKEYFIDSSHLHLDKRIEYIFGKFKLVDIQYNGVPLLKYDYFGGEPHEYIMYETWKIGAFEGKKKIEYYIEENGHFCDSKGNPTNITGKKKIGEIILRIACRKERNNKKGDKKISIYDLPQVDEGYGRISDYDSKYLNFKKEEFTECFSNTQLNRNEQHITGIKIHGFSHNSSRANTESGLKICGLRSELSYVTTSEQTNIMDRECEIQLNKNQHSQKLPKELITIVAEMRKK